MLAQNKTDIQNHKAFEGLYVPDKEKYARAFMRDDYYLWQCKDKKGRKAYVVFQVEGKSFVFHLVNFTAFKTKDMTERFMRDFVKPFCRFRGLNKIWASAERRGMARKLERLGFEKVSDKTYVGEVNHVF